MHTEVLPPTHNAYPIEHISELQPPELTHVYLSPGFKFPIKVHYP